MANPNIVNVSNILGKSIGGVVSTNLISVLANNTSDSVYKVNTIIVSNVDGINAADITARFYDGVQDNWAIASTVTVPSDATLVVLSKQTAIYLEPSQEIKLQANVNGDLEYVISYEIIS